MLLAALRRVMSSRRGRRLATPPISAEDAIAFALNRIDDLDSTRCFLRSWYEGDWPTLRREWPDAFEDRRTPRLRLAFMADNAWRG